MTDKIVVFSTCADENEARRVARHLVEQRAAACATVISGANSTYWWQGKVEESAEWILMIKTSREAFPKLREELLKVHGYQTPEIIALPIVDGSQAYLDWMDREIQLR